MKILLTGGDGQLGQALQQSLVNHELLITTISTLDITNQHEVNTQLKAANPQLIINTAAYTQVDLAEEQIDAAYSVNESGPWYLAQAANELDVPLVHISTDYVFDGSSKSAWVESDETRPLSVYGKSKLAGEQAVMNACDRHYIVRTAWLYHYSGQNFLRTMYGLRDRDEVRVVDDQRGSPTNADDLADALVELIQTDSYGIHHLVNRGEASWYELTCEFFSQLEIDTRVVPVSTEEFPRPAPRPKCSVLHTERSTGIELPHWKTGVARLVAQIKRGGW